MYVFLDKIQLQISNKQHANAERNCRKSVFPNLQGSKVKIIWHFIHSKNKFLKLIVFRQISGGFAVCSRKMVLWEDRFSTFLKSRIFLVFQSIKV